MHLCVQHSPTDCILEMVIKQFYARRRYQHHALAIQDRQRDSTKTLVQIASVATMIVVRKTMGVDHLS